MSSAAASSKGGKKPGLMARLFSTGSSRDVDDEKERSKKRLQRLHSVDVTTFRGKNSFFDVDHKPQKDTSKSSKDDAGIEKQKRKQSLMTLHESKPSRSGQAKKSSSGGGSGGPRRLRHRKKPTSNNSGGSVTGVQVDTSKSSKDDGGIEKQTKRKQSLMTLHESKPSRSGQPKKSSSGGGGSGGGPRRLRHRKKPTSNSGSVTGVQVDTSKPLEYPATPETIYEYHRRRPFLDKNEEWLIVELNEYECLVDSLEVIKVIAKHSKFFEVEPDELWEEFFEFMEDVPSYDEIINYDVWQEFRDNKYPC